MSFPTDENLLVGLDRADDAGVYKISEELALIQTVDFFTPIVDDPYWFGQIAATNALSNIYAMGGDPKTAMNLVRFPIKKMDISVLRQIIQGGLDKMKEAGVVLVGGHSVEDEELKYGLSVTGFVHPKRVLTKKNLKVADKLVLTKPLGTGVINTAIKAGLAPAETIDMITRIMATTNRRAAEIMAKYEVHACTDITGFGLLGHIAEMVEGQDLGITLYVSDIPILPEALEFASMGLFPAGAYKNKDFRSCMVEFSSSIDPVVADLLFDPQTSGGLLISVSDPDSQPLLQDLRKSAISHSSIIGEVTEGPPGRILVL